MIANANVANAEAALGQEILKVLRKAKRDGVCLGAAKISKETEIYRKRGIIKMNDAIVHGILNKLYERGDVVQCKQSNGRGGWKIP